MMWNNKMIEVPITP